MIEFEVNGEKLELFPGAKVKLEMPNPMFSDDAIPGAYTFPVSGPLSPKNLRIIGFADRLDNRNYQFYIDGAKLKLHGADWFKGRLSFRVLPGRIEFSFGTDESLFEYMQEGLNAIEIDTIPLVYPYSNVMTSFRDRAQDAYAGVKDYVFYPVYNPALFNNEEEITWNTGTFTANFVKQNYYKHLNYYFHDNNNDSFYIRKQSYYELMFSPAYYVPFLVEKIYNGFGIKVKSDKFLELDDIKKLTLFSSKNFKCSVADADVSIGTSTQFYFDGTEFNPSKYIPEVKKSDFLLSLKKGFALSYFHDFGRKEAEIIPNRDIIANAEVIDITGKISPVFEINPDEYKGYALNYSHSNDGLISERIKDIREKNILPPVSDQSFLPTSGIVAGDICLVTPLNQYFEVVRNGTALTWAYYSDNLMPFVDGDGENEIETGFDTLVMAHNVKDPIEETFYAAAGGRYWSIPESRSAANTSQFGMQPYASPLRFLFYRGMQNPIGGATYSDAKYPYATYHVTDPEFNIIGDYSLRWDGDYGLFEKWWKPFLDYLRKRPKTVKFQGRLTERDIQNFSFKNKYKVGSYTGFVTRISLEFTGGDTVAAQMDMR